MLKRVKTKTGSLSKLCWHLDLKEVTDMSVIEFGKSRKSMSIFTLDPYVYWSCKDLL